MRHLGASELIACGHPNEAIAFQRDSHFNRVVALGVSNRTEGEVPETELFRGLSSSLALGIERAETVGAKAALVALGDMPFVSPAHFAALVAAFDPATAPIVASDRAGVAMPPAVFDKTVFADLRNGEGDQGARALIRGAALVAADPHELADIDRPEDIQ